MVARLPKVTSRSASVRVSVLPLVRCSFSALTVSVRTDARAVNANVIDREYATTDYRCVKRKAHKGYILYKFPTRKGSKYHQYFCFDPANGFTP